MPSLPFPPQNLNLGQQAFGQQALGQQGFGQQVPANWVAAPQPQMPVMAAMATGAVKANPAPRPAATIRLQAPDTVKVQPAPLVLPSPEALGVRAAVGTKSPVPGAVAPRVAPAPSLDWNSAHASLQRLGALDFHLTRLPQGGFRVTFALPAGDRNVHQIEAVGDSEAAAVNAALEKASTWTLARN